ncbi:MAG: hypothetical protein NZM31_05760 [Gemmatales bacterium]|nr:hypothetical protein [Gemmatales bacterium]MDW8386505.1 hypothetical protein [Gemmatales bacterium]
MAFKPFEFFRKRRRVLLALITIMAMFVFVIGDALIGRPGGGGGPLSRGIMALFGIVPRDRVAVVGGSNLTLTTLRELAAQRESAYRLVLAVRQAAQDAILRKEANFTDADFRLRESSNPEDQRKFLERLENVRTSKPEVWRKLSDIRPCLVNEAVAPFDLVQDERSFFFRYGRLPSEAENPLSAESLVNFVWWQNRADQLGVEFNSAKIKDELLRVAGDSVKPEELPALVRTAFRRSRQESPDLDKLLTWLGEEMRVLVARGIVLGPERRSFLRESVPLSVQATPLDLWNAYVEVRTQLDVGILTIPVNQSHFLQQVPDPTPEQVKEFYTKYRSQEPDPSRDTPGFRIPKLYQIEFVYADLDPTADAGKHYHSWAKAVQALDPMAFFASVAAFYEKNKEVRFRIEEPYILSVSGSEPGQATYYRLAPLPPSAPWLDASAAQKADASHALLAVTGALAVAPAGGSAFAPVLPLSGRTVPREQAQAVELAALVGHAASTALGLGPTGMLAYPPRLGYVEKFVPFTEAYGGIADALTEDLVRNLLLKDLEKLQADLAAYAETYRREYARWRARPGARADSGAKFTPPPFTYKKDGQDVSEPLDDFLKHFAEKRGLVLERMDEMRSQADLLKEKGRTPLNSLLKPLFFETAFLNARQFDAFIAMRLTQAPGLFQARRVPDPEEEPNRATPPRKYALYWKRAEAEARTPPLEEIFADVMQAWKVQEARAIAEAAARDLADKAAKDGADGYRLLRDCPLGEYTEKMLARFEPASLGVGVLNYRRANIPTIEYPTDDFLEQVLSTLQEPGQTLVVTNKPKSSYYVLFLRERRQPRANDPLAVSEFDLQVLVPSPQRQLQVESLPLSEWVLHERYERFLKQWNEYFKDITRFNKDVASAFKGS